MRRVSLQSAKSSAGRHSGIEAGATVLVTGAGGFIGRHLVRALGERYRVVALVRNRADAPENAEAIVFDLSQPLGDALPPRIDAVVHLAQSRRYREFPEG